MFGLQGKWHFCASEEMGFSPKFWGNISPDGRLGTPPPYTPQLLLLELEQRKA